MITRPQSPLGLLSGTIFSLNMENAQICIRTEAAKLPVFLTSKSSFENRVQVCSSDHSVGHAGFCATHSLIAGLVSLGLNAK